MLRKVTEGLAELRDCPRLDFISMLSSIHISGDILCMIGLLYTKQYRGCQYHHEPETNAE